MALMTLEEVADYLRVAKKTIYRLLEKGKIPSRKVGRLWRFDKDSIDTWLHERSRNEAVSILIVDDDEEICSLFRDALEESGFQITTVNNAFEGLELVKGQYFNLVFLDLKMPEMNGAELFKRIKEVKPNLPVTIITGYPDSDLMFKALAYGPVGFMNKPFTASDILAAVNSYLNFRERLLTKRRIYAYKK